MNRPATTAMLLLLLAACAQDTIDRAEWQRMAAPDRVLYVKSLIGAEKVKEAKGGGGRRYELPAEHYVARIDAAYAGGDARQVHEIFEALEPAR